MCLLLQKLYILGGEVAESTKKCTHLIASKVTRTVKFLTAISVVKHIVTPDWLEECFKRQAFVGAFRAPQGKGRGAPFQWRSCGIFLVYLSLFFKLIKLFPIIGIPLIDIFVFYYTKGLVFEWHQGKIQALQPLFLVYFIWEFA